MTASEYRSFILRQQVYLEQLKTGAVADMAGSIKKAETAILQKIQALPVTKLNELIASDLNKLLREVRTVESQILTEATADVMTGMESLTSTELKTGAAALRKMAGTSATPELATTLQKALKNPVSATGELLQPFVDNITPRQLKQTENLIRQGWTNGATVQEMVQGLRGTRARGFKDGITALKTRQAEAVVRTAVQHTSNAVRQELWAANDDIVTGYEWLSTLDDRTTNQCKGLDGQVFKLKNGPTPPIHINCRSTTVPVLDDGLDFLDEGATRSSQFGTVSADTNYYDWLKQQDRAFVEGALGKERAAIFLDEGLSTEDFRKLSLDKNFKPLTAAEMRARLGADILSAPASGTTTGRVWEIGDELKTILGRMPTRAEVIAEATARGINPSTSSTQYGKWKKETGGVVAPPVITPPVAVVRPGMPGKGATRRVWEVSDELTVQLGREPTRVELLARTRELGINDATAGTQFSKWRKAGASGGAPVPAVAPTRVRTEIPRSAWSQAEKDAEWKRMMNRMDEASGVKNVSREKLLKAVAARYPDALSNQKEWRIPGRGWKPNTPPEVLAYHDKYITEWKGALAEFDKQKSAGASALEALKRPVAERTVKVRLGKTRLPKGVSNPVIEQRLKEATELLEGLVHPDVLMELLPYRVEVGKTARAFYRNSKKLISIANNESTSVILHELVHQIEYARPDISNRVKAFMAKRRGSEPLEKLRKLTGNSAYRPTEIAFKDEWVSRGGNAYMGKVYRRESSEILTMGIERLIKDPLEFRKNDPEYFEFLVRTFNEL